MYTPEHYLADASNGELFYDKGGTFTKIYEQIRTGMPEDVRLKKLAASLCGMAQAGQYNYARALSHGEEGAAVLALAAFVKAAATALHLLNGRHAPFYKWMLRSVSHLPALGSFADSLEYLLTGENGAKGALVKGAIVEDICAGVADFLRENGLSDSESDFLEDHAKSVTNKIRSRGVSQSAADGRPVIANIPLQMLTLCKLQDAAYCILPTLYIILLKIIVYFVQGDVAHLERKT